MGSMYKKYASKTYIPERGEARRWPSNKIKKAPVWCSVDLRDGNQSLSVPMDTEDKLRYFKTLVQVGFKEIEVGYPSSSTADFDAVRALIEKDLIPEDVTIQVLVQCRESLIRRTFEAIEGAKHVIFHFYSNTSFLHRRAVFATDEEGVIKTARDAAALVKELGDECRKKGMDLRYEYSPESFSATDGDFAIAVCQTVMETLGATEEDKVIINLPDTVEKATPNVFADEVEYFIDNLPGREKAIISVHTHNDRGTGVAAAELALLAGAERVEGTLFGNGERAGNADIVTLALNMESKGINSGLDFSNLPQVRRVYESCTHLTVPARQPYSGDLAFTAFAGSHQDAINKGLHRMRDMPGESWEVPYLPIDPSDIGRDYEPIIRINSQSGKGGAAFVMEEDFGYKLPKAMHAEFGEMVQAASEKAGAELSSQEIFDLFNKEYVNLTAPYSLVRHSFTETIDGEGHSHVRFDGTVLNGERQFTVTGEGNGPIDAFFNAIHGRRLDRFTFVDYSEHAVSQGSDSTGVAYIHLRAQDGTDIFGVGVSHNINLAPLRGIMSAINRYER